MAGFNRKSTAEQVSEGIDLAGRNALVTGANTGLSKETTRVLALRGARVMMAWRDIQKAEQARQHIIDSSGGKVQEGQLELLALDLNSLASTRDAAQSFKSLQWPLHLLVNNAGIMIPMERRTADAFEAHFGINHLAHFLFTHLIIDTLKAAGGARIVIVSSGAMGAASLTPALEDLNWEDRKFSGLRSYGDSKLMNLMFAREWHKRYAQQGLVANALHSEVIATELARDQSLPFMMWGIFALPFMRSVAQGTATSVMLAAREEYAHSGGGYYVHCRETRPTHKLALEDVASADLWQRSSELTDLDV